MTQERLPLNMNKGIRFLCDAVQARQDSHPQETQQHLVAAAQGARALAPMVHVTTFINKEHSYV